MPEAPRSPERERFASSMLKMNESPRGRRARTARGLLLIPQVLCFLPPSSGNNGFPCKSLEGNNWESLVGIIESSSSDLVVLCPPVVISDDRCARNPNGYIVKQNTSLSILCDRTVYGGEIMNCIVDCPGTHFTVKANATLTIDGMTFRGSKRPSLRIEEYGQVRVFQSKFENNSFVIGNGGAVSASENSRLTINQCEFNNNTALSGGAIYVEGESNISSSNFVNNHALGATPLSGGGAIAIGVFTETTITACGFNGNVAASGKGPAVMDHSYGNRTRSRANGGCNNLQGTDTNTVCNGIQNRGATGYSCHGFDVACPTRPVAAQESNQVLPSNAPTTDPCHLHGKDSFECILHELLEALP